MAYLRKSETLCDSGMFTVLAIAVLCFLCLVTRRYLLTSQSNPAVMHCSTASIMRLLDPPGLSNGDLLAARALPNERLIRAFALTNAFVSCETRVHTAFVGNAKALLRAARERGWSHFQNITIQAVEAALHAPSHHLDFDVFVQDVTLRVALVGLLRVEGSVSELASDDIRVVTELITHLWSLSKKPDLIPEDLLPRLNHHLRRLLPDTEAFENPLDYVIPIWETLWRVVATAIAHSHDNQSALDAFAHLHASVTQDQFKAFSGIAPSAEAIIMETMRLHPPSKHITRFTLSSSPLARLLPGSTQRFLSRHIGYPMKRECADIGTLLRSNIWGSDANTFDPSRHHPSRLLPEQEATKLLVFGYGRNRCIAGSWAPMAAGVITAAVLDRKEDYKFVIGRQIGGREGWNGWLIVSQG